MMYIHGYGSTGKAVKAQQLQAMFPDMRLVSPTFDYDSLTPQEVYRQLQKLVIKEQPTLIVGSSTGGYYALCCTNFFDGTVWCVNPVHNIVGTIERHLAQSGHNISQRLADYKKFDHEVFQQLKPRDGQLHFALSTDDELLGDHRPLLDMFPNYGTVVWKDHCGHRFFRFDELKEPITKSL
jgi:predicted esterase YcpF (UPF0227 family)